ncbi:MAG TPA: RdgB/HAM1 family non-canonical purine NTP pyrophosphatase [Verrucomicrobiae bacterium]|jgi:XTP/dITP diphosphohydrolase|nr:RdgB/HAM1 family non-canonical purine NTP pyrophosphatase [Verrucomicrobiae bacterium]
MYTLVKLLLASSNPGKLREFRALAGSAVAPGVTDTPDARVEIELLPGFDTLPSFEEDAPTFAENAARKALHYSRMGDECVFADDSGLVVPALGGAPGVHSARYAGPTATNADRIAKLLGELSGKKDVERAAHFVCAIALAERGRAIAIVTARVDGEILESPRGSGGFGYDPVFYFPALKKTFAELLPEEKNRISHRGKAFRKILRSLITS